jgi:hypothetical protein
MRPLTMKHEVESLRRQLGLPVPLKVDLGVGRNWLAEWGSHLVLCMPVLRLRGQACVELERKESFLDQTWDRRFGGERTRKVDGKGDRPLISRF